MKVGLPPACQALVPRHECALTRENDLAGATERELQAKEDQLALTSELLHQAHSSLRRRGATDLQSSALLRPVPGCPAQPPFTSTAAQPPDHSFASSCNRTVHAPASVVRAQSLRTAFDARLSGRCDASSASPREAVGLAVQAGPSSALTRPIDGGEGGRTNRRPQLLFASHELAPAPGRGTGLAGLAVFSDRLNLLAAQAQLVRDDSQRSMLPKVAMRSGRSLASYLGARADNPRLPLSHTPLAHAAGSCAPPCTCVGTEYQV